MLYASFKMNCNLVPQRLVDGGVNDDFFIKVLQETTP